jgi:hypothetical protein
MPGPRFVTLVMPVRIAPAGAVGSPLIWPAATLPAAPAAT